MTTPKPEGSGKPGATGRSGWARLSDFFVRRAAPAKENAGSKVALTATVASAEASQTTRMTAGTPSPRGKPDKLEATAASVREALEVNESSPVSTSTPATAPIVVKFTNVTKSFGYGAGAQVAVKDVSFTVEDLPRTGELISIMGPSGCGKSTLLRMIAGLEPHYPQTEGTIEILGRTDNLLPSSERGLVDQKYSLFPHLTVRQNVMFGLDIRGESRSTRGDKADIWIKKVGLDGCEDKYPQELSGGMQQRVAIAATLVLGPRILLMDEPFGALDPKIRLKMQELLVQLWNEQQSTVFVVTHSVEEALYLGDRVFRMGARPGRLMEILQAPRPDMPPEEMRQKKWFVEMTRDLLNRLEQDKLATGELSSYSDFVVEQSIRQPKAPR